MTSAIDCCIKAAKVALMLLLLFTDIKAACVMPVCLQMIVKTLVFEFNKRLLEDNLELCARQAVSLL